MRFSIIVPSYNQDKFIGETFENLTQLKLSATNSPHTIEVLLFDNNSNEATQKIIAQYATLFDAVEITPDSGQYDAINKGIRKITGDYWTWLNTDDKIDVDGFWKLVEILDRLKSDYIYGDIEIVNEHSISQKIVKSKDLKLNTLVNRNPGVYQPGSFFKRQFTDRLGVLASYRACFDYEYVLRLISRGGKLYRCDFTVAQFRYYEDSKSGSIVPVFIKEQLQISRKYGRKLFSKLTFISLLRLAKRKIAG